MEHPARHRKLNLEGAWGLSAACAAAGLLLTSDNRVQARREILKALQSAEAETRKRAADVARRITEKDREFLRPLADELAWILSDTPIGESRTRWHLGLAVARTATTPDQVAVAMELMWRLSEDPSNVVRCSAIEGLGELVKRSPESRDQVEQYLLVALRSGTAAMKCRAQHALRKLNGPARP